MQMYAGSSPTTLSGRGGGGGGGGVKYVNPPMPTQTPEEESGGHLKSPDWLLIQLEAWCLNWWFARIVKKYVHP